MTRWQAWKSRLCTAVFLGVVSTHAALAVPVLSITAQPDPAIAGSTVALDVLITDSSDLYAYQFSLSFDPALLQATGVTEGPFLASGGPTLFLGGAIDNTLGSVSFVVGTLLGAGPGVSGSGVLASIDFDATAPGISPLAFSDVILFDSTLSEQIAGTANRDLAAIAIPEPATPALLGLGLSLAGLALGRRKRARSGHALRRTRVGGFVRLAHGAMTAASPRASGPRQSESRSAWRQGD